MEVVLQGLALAQELRAEDQVVGPEPLAQACGEADGDRRLDDHDGVGVDLHDVAHDALDGAGVEVVGVRVVVRRRRDDDEVGARVGLLLVEGEGQVELTVGEEVDDLLVLDRAGAGIEHLHAAGVDVEADDLVVLGQQDGHGQADITGPDDGDLGSHVIPHCARVWGVLPGALCPTGMTFRVPAWRGPLIPPARGRWMSHMSLTHKNDTEIMRRLIADPGTWVVVGLSGNTDRDAYRVARWLKYEMHKAIIPVHHSAETVDGDQGYASISDIPDGDVKVIDLFVNSGEVGALVDEAIANKDRLQIDAIWMQLGVEDPAAADRAKEAGLQVVMNTCPKIEWRQLRNEGAAR